MTARGRSGLSAEQRERLAARLKGDFSGQSGRPNRIERRALVRAPLSFAQARVWFLAQLEPESSAYHLPLAFTLRGALDLNALRASLALVFDRHEALRTRFVVDDGEPVQVVGSSDFTLAVEDLSSLDAAAAEQAVAHRFDVEIATHFDLAKGPLLRVSLLRLGEQRHVLLMSIHHIVFDEWSFEVLCRELRDAYAALAQGNAPNLAPLPIQYADFAAWQRERLAGPALSAQLGYWQDALDDAPNVIDLPLRGPRPAVVTPAGARHPIHVPRSLTERLDAFARRHDATLFMTLVAAFAVLLSRWSGQRDLLIGTPVTHRNRVETEPLIGLFLNLLALRCDLSGEPTFAELLGRVRSMTLDAFSHQDLPFERLVEALGIAPDISCAPLVQVMFALQRTSLDAFELAGVDVERSEFGTRSAVYDLTLFLNEGENGLVGGIEYNPDLFEAQAMTRFAGHWTTLLEAALQAPETSVHALPCLTPAERARQLVAWNATFERPGDGAKLAQRPLLSLLDEQVARRPREAAFVSPLEGRLDYASLDARARALAGRLAQVGVSHGDAVASCLPRSFDAVVTLIAILRAGATYVPLDPGYPAERLAFMCEDASARAIVTRGPLPAELATLAASGQPVAVDLAATSDDPAMPGADRVDDPDDLAYVIYTSGSTGRPKGVPVRNRQLRNRLAWMWARYPFASGEMSCQKTALSFVDSLWELLGPLLAGSPTVIVPDDILRDPRALLQCLERYRVSRLWLVPSLLRVLLETTPNLRERLPALDMWVTSGEALPTTLARRFAESMPGAKLYNLYGTSEAWDITWHGPVDDADRQRSEPNIGIGRPMANVTCYVLNDAREPQPVGVVGQLYVGGEGLGDGYLNAPGLSASTFGPNPFPAPPDAGSRNARMYATGDLARWRADGTLEFVGRADRQTKLRGFRVEPGEIEALVEADPAVAEAHVLATDLGTPGAALVAYVRCALPVEPQLRERLEVLAKRRLPAHMVPANWVLLDRFPLTPSGKLDAGALPAPSAGTHVPGATANPREPRSDLERTIAGAFASALELPWIGVEEDFFAAGGHSLLAVRVAVDLERALDRPVPLVSLFQARTAEGLARLLGGNGRAGTLNAPSTDTGRRAPLDDRVCVTLHEGRAETPVFVVGTHPGYAELAAALAAATGDGQRVYRLDAYALEEGRQTNSVPSACTVEAMATVFLAHVRERQPVGPYRIGGGCEGAMIAFEMARQLQAAGESMAGLAMWTTPTWFANAGGRWRQQPLVRLASHLRNLLGRGAAAGLSPPAWRRLARHERVEYQLFGAVHRYTPPFAVTGRALLVWPEAHGRWVAPMAAHWQAHLREPAEVCTVPGHHDSWLDDEAAALGAVIGRFFSSSESS